MAYPDHSCNCACMYRKVSDNQWDANQPYASAEATCGYGLLLPESVSNIASLIENVLSNGACLVYWNMLSLIEHASPME